MIVVELWSNALVFSGYSGEFLVDLAYAR